MDIIKRLELWKCKALKPPCKRDALEYCECKDIDDAIAEIRWLRESLRFYADETNYELKKVWTTSMPQYEPNGYKMVTPVRVDKGTRARAALAKAIGGK